jgi:phosphatidylinositol glycan class O
MQRLKGLTTGGLPTFADISASFGGATVDEDSWVQQLVDTVPMKRGVKQARMAFVGDDTWVDLFPTQFEDSHPFPSFNTRDLDSVDDGCLEHLPHLLKSLRRDSNPNGFEVIVAHFLGVDHVGHTYGPHNIHMDAKLRQMDAMIGAVLDVMDDKSIKSCHAALVFGDHGMTEGGNHGGGTQDEINAALFAHFSPGCGDMQSLLVRAFGVE